MRGIDGVIARGGWQMVAVLPSDDYRISATWELKRGDTSFLIDFDGMGLACNYSLPVEESYGCHTRGHHLRSLYFRHPNQQ